MIHASFDLNEEDIFSINGEIQFAELALKVFRYQSKYNQVYAEFLKELNVNPTKVSSLRQIPFLPIEIFKTRKVLSNCSKSNNGFVSSGTTGSRKSVHYVKDLSIYRRSLQDTFNKFYGPVHHYSILALVPNYSEQRNSSLAYMVNDLLGQTTNELSGFYMNNYKKLANNLSVLSRLESKGILIGISYALLDFASKYNVQRNPNLIVMETGGMKGQRTEMVREELHEHLKTGYACDVVHSEYGMTELLSQSYSKADGRFHSPPWMNVLIRDGSDPFSYVENGRIGGINVIDLANLNSCSFIATKDIGRCHEDKSFEVIGRFDNSDIRGCSQLFSK